MTICLSIRILKTKQILSVHLPYATSNQMIHPSTLPLNNILSQANQPTPPSLHSSVNYYQQDYVTSQVLVIDNIISCVAQTEHRIDHTLNLYFSKKNFFINFRFWMIYRRSWIVLDTDSQLGYR